MSGLFLSQYENKIDKKGRVSMPSKFRDVVAKHNKDDDSSIVIYKSLIHECLEGCTVSYLEKLSNAINHFDPFSNEKSMFSAAIFGESVQLDIDRDGRINIPKQYITYAKIDESVIFVGSGNSFQIWNPEQFALHSQAARNFATSNAKLIKTCQTN